MKEDNADFDKFVTGIEKIITRDIEIVKGLSDKLSADGNYSGNNSIDLRGIIGAIQTISETLHENLENLSKFLAIKGVSGENSLIIRQEEDGVKWEFIDNKKNNPQTPNYSS